MVYKYTAKLLISHLLDWTYFTTFIFKSYISGTLQLAGKIPSKLLGESMRATLAKPLV